MQTKKANSQDTLRGEVCHVYFSSDQFVAGRILDSRGCRISFAGKISGLREEDNVILYGKYEFDEKYGEQFRATGYEYNMEYDRRGIINYLTNNPKMKGIGFARAMQIADFCGDHFDQIISKEHELLSHIPGVTQEIANALHQEWMANKRFNVCITQLASYDLTHKQIRKLVDKFGNNATRVIEENPYRLIEEVMGYGFVKADAIARKTGTPKNSPSRIRAAIIYVIENALQDGDCLMEHRDLISRSNAILKLDTLDSRDIIEKELDLLLDQEFRIICVPFENQLFVALKDIYEMESEIASTLRAHCGPNRKFADKDIPYRSFDDLNPGQLDGVRMAVENSVCLISGGAGTGKTYTVSNIVTLYEAYGMSVALCAPTGKAAKRLVQMTGHEASTIHRLIGYDGHEFSRGPENPLDYDVIVIDEVSMLDVLLCAHLFRAIDFDNTCVVLVGDHNQLPPVGPGNILRDIIQREIVPATILSQVVRQAGILKKNSRSILFGKVPPSENGENAGKEWYVIDRFKEPAEILRFILYLYENILHEKLGYDLVRDVQLLAPMKKGVLGVDNLNVELQRLIQKKCFSIDTALVPANRRPKLYVNDKIIQTRNNYDLNIMNGAVGHVKRIESNGGLHHIEFDDGVRCIDNDGMRHIYLAFASTIHKMQGSECECVIAVIHKSQSFMHHRNLFYTAVTRAKKTAIIIGDRWGIRNCAEKESTDKRKTFLGMEEFIGEFK